MPLTFDADRVVAALRRGRLFRDMSEQGLRDLVGHIAQSDHGAAVLRVPPGTDVFQGGDEADRMFVLLAGSFEERSARGETLLWCPQVGDVVGEEALFANDARHHGQARWVSTLRCVQGDGRRQDGILLAIGQELAEELIGRYPVLAVGLLRGLATDSYRLFEEQRRDDEVMRTWFRDRSARLQVGPYCADGAEMIAAVARTRGGGFGPFLPDGLLPVPGFDGVFLAVAARFGSIYQPNEPAVRPFSYNETTLFVPALMPTLAPPFLRFVLYTPALYPDSVLATLLGREIYGFPKRPGRTTIGDGDARLQVDGVESMRLRYEDCPLEDLWDAAGRLGALARAGLSLVLGRADGASVTDFANRWADLLPRIPVAALKQIPGTSQAAGRVDYDVNDLALCPFKVRSVRTVTGVRIHELRIGEALPFAGAELLWPVGFRVALDVNLEPGKRLRSYPRGYEPSPVR
ncbi:MAG: hypothetical protein AMXMBFR64_03870 [Myxococcales bacterium]